MQSSKWIVINPVSTIDIGSEEVEFPGCLAIVAEQVRSLNVFLFRLDDSKWVIYLSFYQYTRIVS